MIYNRVDILFKFRNIKSWSIKHGLKKNKQAYCSQYCNNNVLVSGTAKTRGVVVDCLLLFSYHVTHFSQTAVGRMGKMFRYRSRYCQISSSFTMDILFTMDAYHLLLFTCLWKHHEEGCEKIRRMKNTVTWFVFNYCRRYKVPGEIKHYPICRVPT